MHFTNRTLLSLLVVLTIASRLSADEPTFTRQFDLIYRKQGGFALTMEKVTPTEKKNDAAVIVIISGGWFSDHNNTAPHDKTKLPGFLNQNTAELVKRGYTVFYVVHGSQPKFTIREIHGQISAAVRHIRHQASRYRIDASRIGIMGASAGGHLSLMQGTKGEARKAKGKGAAAASSKVQAVVAYFPPTDFVNYGHKGVPFDKVIRTVMANKRNPFLQALDFLEYDPVNVRLNKVTDKKRLAEHHKVISPLYHVTKDDAPTLLLHGTVDKLVPIQQSQLMVAKFKEKGVANKLYVKNGGNHGWTLTKEEAQLVAGWFDKHLAK